MCLRNLIKAVSCSLLAACLVSNLPAAETSVALSSKSTLSQAGDVRSKPLPIPQWTAIAPKEKDAFEVYITGWTVFSLEAALESPLDIYLFDDGGNLLASFDSTGCGAFLQLDKPQAITVVIVNAADVRNQYILHIYD